MCKVKSKFFLISVIFILITVLIVFSDICKTGVERGIMICGNVIIPSLFPFTVCVLMLMNLEKNKEYEIDDFMLMFDAYGKIISGNLAKERNMNIALSSALRELHDNKEIELKYRSDAEKRWILYPSVEQFNDQIASIVYKGVNK